MAFVASATGLACGTGPEGPDAAWLVGSWDWLRSTGGIAGRTLTPASEGYAVRFVFSGARELEALRRDSVVTRTRFELSETGVPAAEFTIRYAAGVNAFAFDPNLREQLVMRASGDTLLLADPCCDRYEHAFVRR